MTVVVASFINESDFDNDVFGDDGLISTESKESNDPLLTLHTVPF